MRWEKASAFIGVGMGSCWRLGSRGVDDLAWCQQSLVVPLSIGCGEQG